MLHVEDKETRAGSACDQIAGNATLFLAIYALEACLQGGSREFCCNKAVLDEIGAESLMCHASIMMVMKEYSVELISFAVLLLRK